MLAGAPILRVVVVVELVPGVTAPVVQAAVSSAIVIRIPKVFRMGVSLAVAPPTQRVAEKVPGQSCEFGLVPLEGDRRCLGGAEEVS
jgi:hypothetical protein